MPYVIYSEMHHFFPHVNISEMEMCLTIPISQEVVGMKLLPHDCHSWGPGRPWHFKVKTISGSLETWLLPENRLLKCICKNRKVPPPSFKTWRTMLQLDRRPYRKQQFILGGKKVALPTVSLMQRMIMGEKRELQLRWVTVCFRALRLWIWRRFRKTLRD